MHQKYTNNAKLYFSGVLRPLRECEVIKEEQIKLFTYETDIEPENPKTESTKGDTPDHDHGQVAGTPTKESITPLNPSGNGTVKHHHQVAVTNAPNSPKDIRVQENVDSAVKKETHASTQPQQGNSNQPKEESAEGQNAEGEEVSKQAQSKKKNREYLSPAQRQQRQIQRLREKWEKKHKCEGAIKEPAQEDKS